MSTKTRRGTYAACGLPGHRFGRNEGMERFDPQACINLLSSKLEQRKDEWDDLRVRLLQARLNLLTMTSQTHPPDKRLTGKREGIDLALDYMRAYATDPGETP